MIKYTRRSTVHNQYDLACAICALVYWLQLAAREPVYTVVDTEAEILTKATERSLKVSFSRTHLKLYLVS